MWTVERCIKYQRASTQLSAVEHPETWIHASSDTPQPRPDALSFPKRFEASATGVSEDEDDTNKRGVDHTWARTR